jgi:uncharacterized protein (DUF2249 family)
MESLSRIQALLRELRLEIRDVAVAMAQQGAWDLSLPVAVIDGRKQPARLIPARVGTINSVLKASSTIAAPELKRFFQLLESLDAQQAFEICATDAHDGQAFEEAFEEAFEAYRQERGEQGKALWSVEDSAAFVVKSRACFADRELPLVALLPSQAEEGAAIFSFGVPLAVVLNPVES